MWVAYHEIWHQEYLYRDKPGTMIKSIWVVWQFSIRNSKTSDRNRNSFVHNALQMYPNVNAQNTYEHCIEACGLFQYKYINIVSPCIWISMWWARNHLVFTMGTNLVIRPIYIETPPPFSLDVSQEAVPSSVLSVAYNLVQLKLKCLIIPTITLLSRNKLHDCCRTDEDNKVLKILIYEYQAAVESSDTQLPTDPQNCNPYFAIISYTCTTRVFVFAYRFGGMSWRWNNSRKLQSISCACKSNIEWRVPMCNLLKGDCTITSSRTCIRTYRNCLYGQLQ